MPFAQMIREKFEQIGSKAFALSLEFNEAEVLKNNKIYLANTLDVILLLPHIFCFFFFYLNNPF